MTADSETLAVYDAQSEQYETCIASAPTPGFDDFLAHLPRNAHVLDLGCGPGQNAEALLKANHTVDAVDGSAAMVELCKSKGIAARQALFEDIQGADLYDGIWANFSLLHLPRSALGASLKNLHDALRSDGVFHIGMKLGEGEARDRLGRFYAYYSGTELVDFLNEAGFTPISSFTGAGRGLEGSVSNWIMVLSRG